MKWSRPIWQALAVAILTESVIAWLAVQYGRFGLGQTPQSDIGLLAIIPGHIAGFVLIGSFTPHENIFVLTFCVTTNIVILTAVFAGVIGLIGKVTQARFQFGLRALVILVVACAIAFGIVKAWF